MLNCTVLGNFGGRYRRNQSSLSSVLSNNMNFQYEVQDIPGKGKGIIFKQAFRRGEVLYDFRNERDHIVVQEEDLEAYLATVPDIQECLNHGYCSGTEFIDLANCDIRFTNHSFDPCSEYNHETGISIALRDIEVGDEFTENYWNYHVPEKYDALMKKYVNGNYKEQSLTWESK